MIDPEKSVIEMVQADYRTAEVFRKYGINFCCGGQVSVMEACRAREIPSERLIGELEDATRTVMVPNGLPIEQWKLDFLIDYIVNIHHAYMYQVMPLLETRLIGFMDNHRNRFPELEQVLFTLRELSGLLLTHNRHEEEIIFPYIKQIEAAHRRNESYGQLFVRTLKKPFSHIEREHTQILALIDQLEQGTNGYRAPSRTCAPHDVLYQQLREFHNDMLQHKYLENKILFPRAMAIEQQLLHV